ncbi:hypothetical protein AVEN_99962-1 [Araneus ventricosus]|uniref:Uncharacterized protein n=1 Tax=Araneus ventricosus TaxID=182803 RepID=A0A4Y2MX07_ARAVE|nr:hypothetical protein AVEN_99962-1 [Araneus ventricosus]
MTAEPLLSSKLAYHSDGEMVDSDGFTMRQIHTYGGYFVDSGPEISILHFQSRTCHRVLHEGQFETWLVILRLYLMTKTTSDAEHTSPVGRHLNHGGLKVQQDTTFGKYRRNRVSNPQISNL